MFRRKGEQKWTLDRRPLKLPDDMLRCIWSFWLPTHKRSVFSYWYPTRESISDTDDSDTDEDDEELDTDEAYRRYRKQLAPLQLVSHTFRGLFTKTRSSLALCCVNSDGCSLVVWPSTHRREDSEEWAAHRAAGRRSACSLMLARTLIDLRGEELGEKARAELYCAAAVATLNLGNTEWFSDVNWTFRAVDYALEASRLAVSADTLLTLGDALLLTGFSSEATTCFDKALPLTRAMPDGPARDTVQAALEAKSAVPTVTLRAKLCGRRMSIQDEDSEEEEDEADSKVFELPIRTDARMKALKRYFVDLVNCPFITYDGLCMVLNGLEQDCENLTVAEAAANIRDGDVYEIYRVKQKNWMIDQLQRLGVLEHRRYQAARYEEMREFVKGLSSEQGTRGIAARFDKSMHILSRHTTGLC